MHGTITTLMAVHSAYYKSMAATLLAAPQQGVAPTILLAHSGMHMSFPDAEPISMIGVRTRMALTKGIYPRYKQHRAAYQVLPVRQTRLLKTVARSRQQQRY